MHCDLSSDRIRIVRDIDTSITICENDTLQLVRSMVKNPCTVERTTVDAALKMTVFRCGASRASDNAYLLARFHPVAYLHLVHGLMTVKCLHTVAMTDYDAQTIAVMCSGEHHLTVKSRIDRVACLCLYVRAGMTALAAERTDDAAALHRVCPFLGFECTKVYGELLCRALRGLYLILKLYGLELVNVLFVVILPLCHILRILCIFLTCGSFLLNLDILRFRHVPSLWRTPAALLLQGLLFLLRQDLYKDSPTLLLKQKGLTAQAMTAEFEECFRIQARAFTITANSQ